MIPVKLTIEGLYGYRSRQEIDFGPLAEARLFGVFGPIGSGKSSIPEAILLALYGGLERLNQRESRGYNLMNLRSSRLFIEFTFVAGTPPATYTATLETRRNSRRFDDVKAMERKAFRVENGQHIPVALDEIQQALGLSYENFRRTIIIPQGKFQEFIQLEGVEKTKMLKEIFSLGRFDLSARSGILIRKSNSSLENLAGRLSALDEVSQEALDRILNEKSMAEAELAALASRWQELQEKKKEQDRFRDRHASLKALQEKQKELDSLATEMENTKTRIARYDAAVRHFRDNLRQQDDGMHETAGIESECRNLTEQIRQKELLLQQNREMLARAEAESLNRPALELKLSAIPEILRYREEDARIVDCSTRLKMAEEFLLEKSRETIQMESGAAELLARYRDKQTLLPDTGVLAQLRDWYAKAGFIDEKIATISKQIEENHTSQEHLQEEICSRAGHIPGFEQGEITGTGRLKEELEKQLNQIRLELTKTETALEALNHKSVLAEFSASLNDGEPCPLCGALQHPAVYSDPDARAEKDRLESHRNSLRHRELQLQEVLRDTDKQSARLETYQKQAEVLSGEIDKLKHEKTRHLAGFAFEGFSPGNRADFDGAVKLSEQLGMEMKLLMESHEQAMQSLKKAGADRDRARERQTSLQSQLSASQAIATQCRERVSETLWAEMCGFSTDDLKEEQEKLSRLIRRTEEDIKKYGELCANLTNELVALRERLSGKNERLAAVRHHLEEIRGRLEEALDTSPFDTLDQIIHILKDESVTEGLRAELKNWEQERYATLKSIDNLATDPGVVAFDEAAWAALESVLQETEERRESLGRKAAQLSQSVERMQQQLSQKSALLVQKEELENRLTRLNDLKRLFQAAGFVNHISTVYLKNLVFLANQRFQGFTGHRLQLELNDRNEFVVRDLMNNGETRHIKTLSGGQTFLASLSMAIALADIIQGHKPGSGNFFFIDEGFGSLDKPSLQTVFQALQSLSREKRVVGIISHVDELQDEIQTCLRVRLDAEAGSRISTSWQ